MKRGISIHPSDTLQTFLIKGRVNSFLLPVFITHGKSSRLSLLYWFLSWNLAWELPPLSSVVPSIQTFIMFSRFLQGYHSGSDGKESACNAGDPGLIPELGSFRCRREWLFTPVFLPGKSHGQRSLEGCSSWGHKESGITKRFTHTVSLLF